MTASTTTVAPPINSSCISEVQKSAVVSVFVTHITLVVAVIGILVNTLTLIVLRRRTNRGAVTLLLLVLATEDLLIIISYSLYYVAIHYYENYTLLYWLGQVRYVDSPLSFLLNWVKVAEIYTILLLSFQRHFAIRWPLHAARICSVGRTKRLLIVIVMLSGFLKLPNLILGYQVLTFDPACQKEKLTDVFQDYDWYPGFRLGYTKIVDQVVGFLIPLCVLVVLNMGLIIRVRQATRQQQRLTLKSRSSQCTVDCCCSSSLNYRNALVVEHTKNNSTENCILRGKHYGGHQCASLQIAPQNVRQEVVLSLCRANCTKDQDTEVSTANLGQPVNRECRQLAGQWHNSQSCIGTSSGQVHSRGVTLTLIGVVTTFIIFEFPTTVCFCIEIWDTIAERIRPSEGAQPSSSSSLYAIMYTVALLSSIVNCASNFFIYMLVGRRFRRLFFAMFRQMGRAVAIHCFCYCYRRNKSWPPEHPGFGHAYSRRGSSSRITTGGGCIHKQKDDTSDILSNAITFGRNRLSPVDALHQQTQAVRPQHHQR